MVTSAADLGGLQTKPNQIMHIYPYMIYLFENAFLISLPVLGHINQRFQEGISCRVKYALFGLIWFGSHPNQLQRSPLQCPWSGIFKKVYHVGVNIDYLGCLHWRLQLEVTMISCRGHPNQLQRSPLHCPWCGIFKKV